jgi:hypothetical protein
VTPVSVSSKSKEEDKAVVLTTDTEAEIEITRSGIKKTSIEKAKVEPPRESSSSKSSEEQKLKAEAAQAKQAAVDLVQPIATTAPVSVRDEFAMEKAEAELLKAQRRSHNDPIAIQKMKDSPQLRAERNEVRPKEEEEEEVKPSSPELNREIDPPKSQTREGRPRESIVEGRPAGIGGGGDSASAKENSVCSGNLDPYKGYSPPTSISLLLPSLSFSSLLCSFCPHRCSH